MFFQSIEYSIQKCGNQAKQHDREHYPIHFKDLWAIDDQITKSFSGGEKFSNNYSDQAKSDIDFQNTKDCRKVDRKNNFGKTVQSVAMQGIDQF